MKYFFFILLFIVAGQNIPAQNAIDIFKMELPYNVLNSKTDYARESINFDYYSKLEPSLIGYYLHHLNKNFLESVTHPDSNYFNLLLAQTNNAIERRNAWLEMELEKSWDNIPTVILSQKVNSFLNNDTYLKRDFQILNPVENRIDLNFVDYCSYKFIYADASLSYDTSIVYSELIPNVIKSLSVIIESNFNSANTLSKENRDVFAEKSLSHFSLFNNSYGSNKFSKIELHAYEYLQQLFAEEYVQHSVIGIVLGSKRFDEKTFYNFNFYEKLSDLESVSFNETIENKFSNSIYIGLHHNQKIRELKRPYSYISLGINISLNTSLNSSVSTIPDSINTYFVIRPDTGMFGYRVDSRFKFKRLTEPSIKTFSAQLSIPVYYAFRKLYFELGLDYTFFSSSFKYSIERSDKFFQVNNLDPSLLVDYKKEMDFTTIKHYFYPTITLNYDLTNYLTLKGRYLIGADNLNLEIFAHL